MSSLKSTLSRLTSPTSKTFSAFDLTKAGLSATLSVGVFLVIGYVARYIAGPSVILSVIIAAIIAFLAGTFFAELNSTIVCSSPITPTPTPSTTSTVSMPSMPTTNSYSSEIPSTCTPIQNTNNNKMTTISTTLLLPSFIFTYLCIGEFAAFVIGWNLILEYVIGVAIVSKGIAYYMDMLIFDSFGINITQITSISWNLSDYFDFFSFFIPILIGGPLVMVLKRTTVLNTISVFFSLIVVVVILISGIFKANISNWNSTPSIDTNNSNSNDYGTGGFFPFGVSGMIKGVTNILFVFIGFDAMVIGTFNWCSKNTRKIGNFQKTVQTSVSSITGIVFVCLIGIAIALTTIKPYYLLDKELPLPSAFSDIGWSGAIFIILIGGIISLFGSLYALMHAILRTIQAMATDGIAFKLFGKFQHNNLQAEIQRQCQQQKQHAEQQDCIDAQQKQQHHQYHHEQQQQPILGCLIFSLLAGLLAALFSIKQLINLLSIGTLLMFYTLTMDIILLRYSTNLQNILHRQETVENGTVNESKQKRPISLIAILLAVYCALSKLLAILIKLVQLDILQMRIELLTGTLSIIVIVMVSIVFVMGLQSERNSIFELKLSVNPIFPALNLFACVYLLTQLDVTTWIRYLIWMLIGIALYIISLKVNRQRRHSFEHGNNNNGFISDHEHNLTTVTEMDETTATTETLKQDETIVSESIAENKSVTPDIIPKSVIFENGTRIIRMNEEPTEMATIHIEAMSAVYFAEHGAPATIAENTAIRKPVNSQIGFDEIYFADDVKGSCIEKREPNGKVYFIEMDPVELLEMEQKEIVENLNESIQWKNKDENIVNEILERVLSQTDTIDELAEIPQITLLNKFDPKIEIEQDAEDDVDEFEKEKEVKAIIHSTNESIDSEYNENKEEMVKLDKQLVQEIKSPSVESSLVDKVQIANKENPFFSIGVYKSPADETKVIESDGRRKEFKEHLKRLIAQSQNPNDTMVRSIGRAASRTNKIDELIDRRPSLKSFKSTPKNMTLAYATDTERQQLQIYKKNSTENGVKENANIPVAPQFDHKLYNSVGVRIRNHPATAMSIENEFEKSFQNAGALHRTKKSGNLSELFQQEQESATAVSIKEQLERILGRGRPEQLPYANAITSETSDVKSDAPEIAINHRKIESRRESELEDGINFLRPIKPYDTVRKQKQLFSDVLKAIKPDVRTSLHRTSSTASSDIQSIENRQLK